MNYRIQKNVPLTRYGRKDKPNKETFHKHDGFPIVKMKIGDSFINNKNKRK